MFGNLFKRKLKRRKQEPLVIANDFGIFTMEYRDKYNTEPLYAYEGSALWRCPSGDTEIDAEIPCDKGADREDRPLTADKGFARLRKLLSGTQELDARIKQSVLEEFMDRASGAVDIWGSSEDFPDGGGEISPEEFVSRLTVDSAYIQEDGSVCFLVGLDEMFTDHAAEITLLPDGSLTDCKLIG